MSNESIVHIRADQANGQHTTFTVFMHGANCGQLTMKEEEDWMQHVSDEIEEDGTEGTFREYCLNKGFKDGCSTGCIEEALRSSSTKLHYRAGLAHAFCSSKR